MYRIVWPEYDMGGYRAGNVDPRPQHVEATSYVLVRDGEDGVTGRVQGMEFYDNEGETVAVFLQLPTAVMAVADISQ